MAVSALKCRGFAHPVVFLIRSCLPQQTFIAGRSQCFKALPTARSPTRLFTTSRFLFAQANSKATLAVPRPGLGSGTALSRGPSASYANLLSQNKNGTTLYEAAPGRLFLLSAYSAGLLCTGAAVVNLYLNVLNTPPGVGEWVPYAFGALALALAIFGMHFAFMPANVIRSIRVLPAPSPTSLTARSAPARLEIKVRRLTPIPGFPLKTLEVEPAAVTMKARMYNPRVELSAEDRFSQRQEAEQRKKAERQYEMDHLMSAPFRHGATVMSNVFAGLRKGLTGEGFAPIEIQGKHYRLDISSGYALDDGRALDRVVNIAEDAKVAQLREFMQGNRR